MQTETILLTGVTGNLGSWLAGEMLRQGNRVLALMRNSTYEDADKRLDRIFNIVGADPLRDNIEAVLGDICDKGLGSKLKTGGAMNISKVVHCAACTKFGTSDAESIHVTNIEGTGNVLELARDLSVPVVHVSSAYVAGKRTGVAKEDELDMGQDFNNVYEYTKNEAEKLVCAWSKENSIPTIILRPSIVMGDTVHGRTIRFNSMYDLIRVLELIMSNLGDEVIRIAANGETTKNIIPVDYFAETAWCIINANIPGTYHITNPSPPTLSDLAEILSNLFGKNQYKFIPHESFDDSKLTRIEQIVNEAMTAYKSYTISEPVFDQSNTQKILSGTDIVFPSTDEAYFRCLLDYANSVKWRANAGIALEALEIS